MLGYQANHLSFVMMKFIALNASESFMRNKVDSKTLQLCLLLHPGTSEPYLTHFCYVNKSQGNHFTKCWSQLGLLSEVTWTLRD